MIGEKDYKWLRRQGKNRQGRPLAGRLDLVEVGVLGNVVDTRQAEASHVRRWLPHAAASVDRTAINPAAWAATRLLQDSAEKRTGPRAVKVHLEHTWPANHVPKPAVHL